VTTLAPRRAWTLAISDTAVMTTRYLHHYLRKPSLLAIALAQPVLFVLLWTYVFSGAIQTPAGIAYVDHLMPGLFILAIAFGSANTGIGLADDLAHGLLDRFRVLPMARPALLAGRTLADTARNTFVVLLMVAVGYAVGFRCHAGPAAALAALALPLAVGYLRSWISALIGLTVRDPETAGTASLLPVIPLAFTSSTFVPVATMPGWLQTWANSNPLTHAVDATRALALGGPTSGPLLKAIAWILGILAVVIPLAIHRYRRVTQRTGGSQTDMRKVLRPSRLMWDRARPPGTPCSLSAKATPDAPWSAGARGHAGPAAAPAVGDGGGSRSLGRRPASIMVNGHSPDPRAPGGRAWILAAGPAR
jgi:ABC transporter DrrB family efflux protein